MKSKLRLSARMLLLLGLLTSLVSAVQTQTRGSLTLFGDVKVEDSSGGANKLGSLTVILYAQGGATIVGRTTVPIGGRYRFNNIPGGEYELAVEAEMSEIARIHVSLGGRPGSDFQQDLEFALKPLGPPPITKPGTVSTADLYQRNSANQSRFEKAQRAIDLKQYNDAATLLTEIVGEDKSDFQAWTELGTAYLFLDKKSDAEKAYENGVEARPNFKLALLNLGRLRVGQKKYADAIQPLSGLLELDPQSAEGNLLLGEAYLQIKKGSKAVSYLNAAANLGRPEAHLRLATLYDAVGLKDKAAIEYEEFLKKKPEYADRKKLEKYIADNKKP